MSPLRSFSAGIITTLLIIGTLVYWYLPHLRVVPIAPLTRVEGGSTLSGSVILSPLSGGSGGVYMAQPFATPISTDCSQYETKQRIVCEADLANTIYSQFVTLSPTEQLVYDCMRLRTDIQQAYCKTRQTDIPREQRKSKILEIVGQSGISACSEFGSSSEVEQCQLDVALGRLAPVYTGSLATQTGSARPTPPVSHCEILSGDLRVRCDREVSQMQGPRGDGVTGSPQLPPSAGPTQP